MRYLFQGKLPADDEKPRRVIVASRFLRVEGRDLIINGRDGNRVVPAISEHYELLDSYHRLNHCHGEQLYKTLACTFYQRGMRINCLAFVASCRACQSERTKFRQPDALMPCFKEVGPLRAWSIDLITGLPEGSNGKTVVAVAVDVFAKFVVATPVANKSSGTVAWWFYQRLVCEYGCPLWVRSD